MNRLTPILPPLVFLLIAAGACAKPDGGKPAAPAQPAAKAAASGGSRVVAVINGKEYTLDDVDNKVRPQLMDLAKQRAEKEHQIRQQGLEQILAEALVGAEAKKRGLPEEQLVQQEVQARATPPTEAEMKAFYEQNKAQINKPFDAVKTQLQQYLQNQKNQRAFDEFLNSLRAAAQVKLDLPPADLPKVDVAATGPSKGPANAPVTIVIFSEYQCPFCSQVQPALKQVEETYKDKVRVVFRDYPLSFHPNAPKAAEAGHCADEQGKFWEMHDKMFANQAKLAVPDLKQLAREIGLDGAKFDECLDSGRSAEKVKANMADAEKVGVNGTPSFFINGRPMSGAIPFDEFKKVIDAELKGI